MVVLPWLHRAEFCALRVDKGCNRHWVIKSSLGIDSCNWETRWSCRSEAMDSIRTSFLKIAAWRENLLATDDNVSVIRSNHRSLFIPMSWNG